MRGSRASSLLLCGLVLIQLLAVQIDAQRPKTPWKTLSGECSLSLSLSLLLETFFHKIQNFCCLAGRSPRVIARGGFSGLFPDSSLDAYNFALQTGVADTVLWCDLQLTKDGAGICFPDLTMSNASNVEVVYPQGQTTYPVNGVPTPGWFTIDFSLRALSNVSCKSSFFFTQLKLVKCFLFSHKMSYFFVLQ